VIGMTEFMGLEGEGEWEGNTGQEMRQEAQESSMYVATL